MRRPECGHTFSHACTALPCRASSSGSPSGSGGSTPSTPPSGMSARRHKYGSGTALSITAPGTCIRDRVAAWLEYCRRKSAVLHLADTPDQAFECLIRDGPSLARPDRAFFQHPIRFILPRRFAMRVRFIRPSLPRQPLLRLLVVAGMAIVVAALLATGLVLGVIALATAALVLAVRRWLS